MKESDYQYTNQKQLRKAFREENPDLDFRKIKDHEGTGKMYVATTRVNFVDFIDNLHRRGAISDKLAQRATLD